MESMTSNPASVIDEGQFTVRRTIRIAAPIEKVWSAVTEPEHISRWFGKAVLVGAGVGARTWRALCEENLHFAKIDAGETGRLAVAEATFHTAPGHPGAEHFGVMFASLGIGSRVERRATKLGRPNHERFIEHAA